MDVVEVSLESEQRVKGDAQDFWVIVDRYFGVVYCDFWLDIFVCC
jgi:hypothetical protein